MKILPRILTLAALILAIGATLALRKDKAAPAAPSAPTPAAPLPRLVDLGAGKCIPCKAMAPILEELRKEYAGQFEVVFIDVWENPDAAGPYEIDLIPTQIFFDAAGRELWRHEGFLAKADILAKWREFGVGEEDGAIE